MFLTKLLRSWAVVAPSIEPHSFLEEKIIGSFLCCKLMAALQHF